MSPSFGMHRRLHVLISLILLCALSSCITAAKFCVAEKSVDFARAALFCVQTNLKAEKLSLRADQKSVAFSVSNRDKRGVSEVLIEYDLIFTLPKKAADQITLELYFNDQGKTLERKDEGKDAVFTCSRAGVFEAGRGSEHSFSLRLKANKKIRRTLSFRINLTVSARQIISGI